jgi:hypothetical protein
MNEGGVMSEIDRPSPIPTPKPDSISEVESTCYTKDWTDGSRINAKYFDNAFLTRGASYLLRLVSMTERKRFF